MKEFKQHAGLSWVRLGVWEKWRSSMWDEVIDSHRYPGVCRQRGIQESDG